MYVNTAVPIMLQYCSMNSMNTINPSVQICVCVCMISYSTDLHRRVVWLHVFEDEYTGNKPAVAR